MNRNSVIIIVIIIVVVLAFWLIEQSKVQNAQAPRSNNTSSSAFTASPAIKHSGCVEAGGLPDRTCTPGAVDPRVTQDNINSTICSSGYTKTVRPPASYTDELKRQQMRGYNLSGSVKDFEEDHLIPLELGGSPTDEANLWPEPYAPSPGAKDKDHVENYLHAQVCKRLLTLAEAQREIATNWIQVYQTTPGITHY